MPEGDVKTMLNTITPDIVIGYLQCQRKGFLLLDGKERGSPHEIDEIVKSNLDRHRHEYKQLLRQEGQDLQTFTPKSFLSGLDLFVDAQLVANGLESYCDALTKQSSTVNHHAPIYEPTLVSSGHSVQAEDKTRLLFSVHVLTKVQGKPPKYGFLVTSGSTVQKMKLENNCKVILKTVAALQEWIESKPLEEPRVMLNKHCNSCQFRLQCEETAEKLDDLSLLGIAQTCRFQGKSFLKFLLSKQKDVDLFKASRPLKSSVAVGPSSQDNGRDLSRH